MKKFKIGIVGHGFVGKAVDYGFELDSNEKFIVDPKHDTTIDDLIEFNPNITFVCLPTPMGENGEVNADEVENAILKVVRLTRGAVVLKSTVPPDIINRICHTLAQSGLYKRFVYNPEFLTEANSIDQFVNPQFQIFGGDPEACGALAELYAQFSIVSPSAPIVVTPVEASFIKYGINSFLAMKVTFFNQLFDAVKEFSDVAKYNAISTGIGADYRIGSSHTKVPGYDFKRGFGGACLPKDTSAILNTCPELTLLKEVININNQYRSQYDLDDREKEQNVNYG